jgi:ParB family chromosome partitioning protein
MVELKHGWVIESGDSCNKCDNGLCARMNELMEMGHSMRAASRTMEKECNGKWKAVTLRNLFQVLTSGSDLSHRTKGTGENEWFTPDIYIDSAREVMGGIDLDPATSKACQKRIKAKKYYTTNTNGLDKDWSGNIWLNPPYSKNEIKQFIDKLIIQINIGNVSQAIVLTHSYTDTLWFHKIENQAALICFTKGRIQFEEDDGHIAQPTQGQCFFYVGKNLKKFKTEFGRYGFIR